MKQPAARRIPPPARAGKPSPPAARGATVRREAEVGGAQSIGRALDVLKLVGAEVDGIRLREVVAATGLAKGTAYRILQALVARGFLRVRPGDARYELGCEALVIGWSAQSRQSLREVAEPSLERICAFTGDTVFLSVRSGPEAVCVARHVGDFPIKTLTLEIGSRRPLGVGSGSLALLAFLPDREIEEVLTGLEPRLAPFPLMTVPDLRTLARETRAQGHSFNDERVISGMSAVGVPVLDAAGRPVAALSVAAVSSRMLGPRRREIVEVLIREAALIAGRLRTGAGPGDTPFG